MQASRRQAQILREVTVHGACNIGDLARSLSVSDETIRRDIAPLARAGRLVRVHGGVILPDPGQEPPFQRRMLENREAKIRIASLVADRIEDGDSLMLDTGSTTTYVARALRNHNKLMVVTNCTEIARILAPHNGNRVYMAGGEIRADDAAVFGATAIGFVGQFQVRYAILSIGAISSSLDFMDYHLCEAEFSRAVMNQAQQVIVVADSSKFGRDGFIRVCGAEQVGLLVSDRPPEAAFIDNLREAGTRFQAPPQQA